MRSLAGAKKPNAFQERAIGNASRSKDDLLSRGEVVGIVDFLWIIDAHRAQPVQHLLSRWHLVLINAKTIRIENQTRLNLAVQAFHGGSSDYAFRRTTDTHQRMNIGAGNRGGNTSRQIAVRNKTYTCTGRADFIDQLLVPLAIQNDDCQILNVPAKPPRDVFEVVFHWSVNINHPARRWPDNDLVHVNVRSIQESASLSGCQDRNGIIGSQRAKVRPFERIDRYINFRTYFSYVFGNTKAAADLFSDIEHRRLVSFAFTDHNPAAHGHAVHDFAHGFNGNVIGELAIPLTHCARRRNCSSFADPHEIQTQLPFGPQFLAHFDLLLI